MSETNYEHYKEQLLAYTITIGECDFIQEKILKRSCTTEGEPTCEQCRKEILRWLKQPYEEPAIEIDWTKVPIDTPVYVSDNNEMPDASSFCRHFKCVNEYGKFVCFDVGRTSFSNGINGTTTTYKYCALARPEDVEKYRKQ